MIAAAATAAPDTSPASSQSSGGTAASPAPAGFDTILVLQSLAATAEMSDPAALDAADLTDALATDDSDDDDSGDDLETSLAFLSALITATTPKGSPGEFESGAGGQGRAQDDSPALPLAIKADTGFALGADAADKAEALLGLGSLRTESLDQTASADASQNLSRAAELLAQAQRPTAEVEKPAVLTHARDPRWADDFSARVSLMVRAGESTASLQLTPVDLGPVEVNVTVKDSQATIHFGATQADTRALIEASLPKLRELLASQGFNLMDASVSSGFSRSQQQSFTSGNRGGGEAEPAVAEVRTVKQLGLLDLYA